MKQSLFAIFLICLIVGGIALFTTPKNNITYLRIHILANSNSQADQSVKYEVKESIVEFLTPLLTGGTTVEKAKQIVQSNLTQIEESANKTLNLKGFCYSASAGLKQEFFPTRVYDDLTLESGVYQSLIIRLGQGEGDNWWCVVYPPLCFVSQNSAGVVYKSKLLEIIKSFKKRYK